MTSVATMFLNNVTSIDHAYISSSGEIIGGSVSPLITVTGKVDDTEQVVVDFSNIKKEIKSFIDGPEGFDHKLWIIDGISGGNQLHYGIGGGRILIRTNQLTLSIPSEAVVFIEEGDTVYSAFKHHLQSKLSIQLSKIYNTELKVSIDLDFAPSLFNNTKIVAQFRYVHGLKNSTSYGCQNIAHGHNSWISCDWDSSVADRAEVQVVINDIARFLDRAIFVWKDNYCKYKGEDIIEYSTKERGRFELRLLYPDQSIIILRKETTIENLVEWAAEIYREKLKKVGVTTLYMSEGQNKGARFNL